MDFNPYKVFAIDPSADVDIINAVYRTLSKKYHPDLNKSPEAEQKMRDINRAYDMLKDPEQRRRLDDDLARQSSSRSGTASAGAQSAWPRPGARPPENTRPPQAARSRTTTPDFSNIVDKFRRGVEDFSNSRHSDERPSSPNDRTLYFYQKQLVDHEQRKSIKVAVFHDGATNRKLCHISASAPNRLNQVTSGEVFLDSSRMFDLTLAFSEAARVLADGGKPVEMNSDHDVLLRQPVEGLGRTYIAIEVIKQTRSASREALLLIGEKNARTEKDGVISNQTPTQLEQIGRIFKTALEAMR